MRLLSYVPYSLLMLTSRLRTVAAMSTSAKPSSALVFLHGLGDSPAGWSQLEYSLPRLQPRLSNVKYVFPAAPDIPLTINGNMIMPSWFDLYDWPIGVGCKDDRVGMLKGVAQVREIVEKLKSEDGIDPSRIVVGGFSQGGAIALLSAYHESNESKFAGCASLSGWLTLKDEINPSPSSSETPLLWGHGEYDDKVLFEQQAFGVNLLREKGVKIEASQYEMGHESHPEEMAAFAKFLDNILFQGEEKQME